MDIRVLRYFLAIAREESFSRAAEVLHLTQPTLSRQIRDLEEELGVTLFERSSHAVLLTRDGLRLRKRAQELTDLMDRTAEEFAAPPADLSGDVYIGCTEACGMQAVAHVAALAQREHPGVRFHLHAGSAEDVMDRLDRGLVDFGVLATPAPLSRCEALPLPGTETWGLLMRRDHPLSRADAVTAADLTALPLIVSSWQRPSPEQFAVLGVDMDQLTVVATCDLIANAAMLVRERMGCALVPDVHTATDMTDLTFRPLTPRLASVLSVVWKKYPVFSPAAEDLLHRLKAAYTPQDN